MPDSPNASRSASVESSSAPAGLPATAATATKPAAGKAARDPSRPKRKKARRACAACQRAHLTCGDERPCERCIKRGLQDDCHDGARKKAKYLRDAPDDALKPGAARFYGQTKGGSNGTDGMDGARDRSSSNHFAPGPPSVNPESLPPPISSHNNNNNNNNHNTNGYMDNRPGSMHAFSSPLGGGGGDHLRRQSQDGHAFHNLGSQPSPMSNQFNPSPDTPLQSLSNTFNQPFEGGGDFTSAFLDPADSSLFGYDTSSLNFGNQYGALEFVTLGHMASGANNPTMHRGSAGYDTSNGVSQGGYLGSPVAMPNFSFQQPQQMQHQQHGSNDWQATNDPRMNSWATHGIDHYTGYRQEPNTYSIGATNMGASPASTGGTGDFLAAYESTPPALTHDSAVAPLKIIHTMSDGRVMSPPPTKSGQTQREHRPNRSISRKLDQVTPNGQHISQRRRNASKIYASVIKPYPYTARFHALIALIQRRFHSTKRLRIAKALASIRPSFISCTRTLIEEDLVLMEKNFQRSLLEYRDHVSSGGTPTIICRRTGEVAYCGESFLLLSGWPVNVLSGREPNLNVNRAGTDTEAPSRSSRGGFTTPRGPGAAGDASSLGAPSLALGEAANGGNGAAAAASKEIHPVFLSDLLDDDSVIHFYEDFAKIAFADSKGSARRRCRLVKYKTRDDLAAARKAGGATNGRAAAAAAGHDAADRKHHRGGHSGSGSSGSHQQQHDISRLGEDDGTVDCMFTWTVKRDVFEFPMMVVINFLPILDI